MSFIEIRINTKRKKNVEVAIDNENDEMVKNINKRREIGKDPLMFLKTTLLETLLPVTSYNDCFRQEEWFEKEFDKIENTLRKQLNKKSKKV